MICFCYFAADYFREKGKWSWEDYSLEATFDIIYVIHKQKFNKVVQWFVLAALDLLSIYSIKIREQNQFHIVTKRADSTHALAESLSGQHQ